LLGYASWYVFGYQHVMWHYMYDWYIFAVSTGLASIMLLVKLLAEFQQKRKLELV